MKKEIDNLLIRVNKHLTIGNKYVPIDLFFTLSVLRKAN